MKVGLLEGPGRLALADRPAPRAGAGEVVVELAACGVCGTDLEKVRGNYQTAGRLGHEPVGRVVELGDSVTGLALGDRVFVHHHVPCLECAVCARGEYTFCPSYARTNIDPGGFSERFRVPRENVERHAVLPLDDSVDWATGTLLEPAACALTALHRVGFARGDTVFVTGLGPVGLLYVAIAKALGARWVGGAELSARRRDAARAHGADAVVDPRTSGFAEAAVREATAGVGVDLSVAATGVPAAVRLSAELPRRGGTLNLFGLPESGSRLDVDLQKLYLQGMRVVPTYATTEPDIREVHSMLVDGRLDLRGLVSDLVPLERIQEAFDRARDAEHALKVAVTGPAYRR